MRGEPAAAIEPLRRSLRIRQARLGPTHVDAGYAASFLAEALQRAGDRAEAMVVARLAPAAK